MAYAIQNSREKAEQGSKAPWYARWKDVDGKVHSLKVGKRADAMEIAKEKERNALRQGAGLLLDVKWADFRAEYEKTILPTMRSERSRESSIQALDKFEELASPCLVRGITSKDLQRYAGKRAVMQGHKPGSKMAAATILKELRTVRAALSYAHQWQYLPVVPDLPSVDGFESDKRFVTVEHFDAMLANLSAAKRPTDVGCSTAEWWDALLSLLWVAPNRIQAMLSLRWENVDLDGGTILTTARSTKQKRDHRACLPQVVADKLRLIRRFEPRLFAWNYGESTLYRQFFKIQKAAGIKLVCTGEHECTDSCQYYGFHDFRRSFATLNEDLPASMKQGQMGHSSYATTQRYEQFAKSRQNFAGKIYLPPSMQKAEAQ